MKKIILAAVLVFISTTTNAHSATMRPYYGRLYQEKSSYPTNSLGQYIEACDPARDNDNDSDRRRQNGPWCEGYAQAIIEATYSSSSACFPAKGVVTSLVLTVGQLRASKDRGSLQKQAFAQLTEALSEQFPCKN